MFGLFAAVSFRSWRSVGSSAAAVAAALLLAGPNVAHAQAIGRTVPTGNPLDPYGRSQNSDDDSQEQTQRPSAAGVVDPTGGMEAFEPVRVAGSDQIVQEGEGADARRDPRLKPAAQPNEFERYVENAIGRRLPRFGASLMVPSERDFARPATAAVPPEYILNVGDVITISLAGSTEGSVDKQIDSDGKIFLPKVGSITLAGVRYADLRDRISAAIGTQYRGYDVTVSIRQLRGVRVYVTGFANNPGAYTVGSLSTMVNAVLAAGGPSSGGSFRVVELVRNGQKIAEFDLYQFVRDGSRSGDVVLQNEDVLRIAPLGKQVAIVGSVNEEAIYEAKPGETIDDILRLAGGANELADDARLVLYRISELDAQGAQEIRRDELASMQIIGGDLLQVLSQGTLQRPTARQSVLVRVEGEVNKPGNYFVPANTTLAKVMEQVGGLTSRAFVYGTRLERTSVRRQQREAFAEAVQQLEMSLAAAPLTNGQTLDAGERGNQLAAARTVLERLREAQPDGRVVLDLAADAKDVPADLVLENNDRIVIPARASTVGVFGAVYRPASFYLDPAISPMRVKDYLDRAGGPMRAADKGGIFVVRANGSVLSKRSGALSARVLPGDVVFVPVKTQSASFWTRLREISTIIFQFGISAAALAAIR